ERIASASVDDFALRVHHVIIFQKALADTKVVFFHLLLRALYRVGHHPMLDDLPFFQPKPVHDPRYALRHEQTHEVVFERHIKLRRSRVSLTARTTPQLTVDAPRLMTFRADNGEASCRTRFRRQLDV